MNANDPKEVAKELRKAASLVGGVHPVWRTTCGTIKAAATLLETMPTREQVEAASHRWGHDAVLFRQNLVDLYAPHSQPLQCAHCHVRTGPHIEEISSDAEGWICPNCQKSNDYAEPAAAPTGDGDVVDKCPQCGAAMERGWDYRGRQFAKCRSRIHVAGKSSEPSEFTPECTIAALTAERDALAEKLKACEEWQRRWDCLNEAIANQRAHASVGGVDWLGGVLKDMASMDPRCVPAPAGAAVEDKPERPPMLRASVSGERQRWWMRTTADHGIKWLTDATDLTGTHGCGSASFTVVNRDASDARALELYDADLAKEQR
jgi:hypothetical protein